MDSAGASRVPAATNSPCSTGTAWRSPLLAIIGQHRKHEEAVAAQQRKWEEGRERAERAERERQAAHEAAQPGLQAKIEAAFVKAFADQWAWPNGKTLTFYKWTWQTGRTDEGCEYDDGYSLSDKLSDDGWLNLTAQRWRKPRQLKLCADFHLPIAEKIVVTGVTDLPECFRDIVQVRIDGIGRGSSGFLEEGEALYAERPHEQPIQWIREMLSAKEPTT